MAAPISGSSNVASMQPLPTEVIHEKGSDINGVFLLPNGKKYKLTRLTMGGEDLIGGKAAAPRKLTDEQIQAITNMFNAICKDKATQDAISKTTHDTLSVSIGDDPTNGGKKIVSVSGKVDKEAKEVFSTNSVQYESFKKDHELLIHLIKTQPIPQPVKPSATAPAAGTNPPAASSGPSVKPAAAKASGTPASKLVPLADEDEGEVGNPDRARQKAEALQRHAEAVKAAAQQSALKQAQQALASHAAPLASTAPAIAAAS